MRKCGQQSEHWGDLGESHRWFSISSEIWRLLGFHNVEKAEEPADTKLTLSVDWRQKGGWVGNIDGIKRGICVCNNPCIS